MRLKSFDGKIVTVAKVIPAVEMRVKFNNHMFRMLEECKAGVEPNALIFSTDAASNPFNTTPDIFATSSMCCGMGNNIFIGNLKTEVAKGILDDLLKKEYADISGLKYQKEEFDSSRNVFDNGKSAAYINGCFSFNHNFSGVDNCNYSYTPNDCEEAGVDDLDDEELREYIYNTGGYTIKELGDMERAELEQRYAVIKGGEGDE